MSKYTVNRREVSSTVIAVGYTRATMSETGTFFSYADRMEEASRSTDDVQREMENATIGLIRVGSLHLPGWGPKGSSFIRLNSLKE